jgi:hypothetical protein
MSSLTHHFAARLRVPPDADAKGAAGTDARNRVAGYLVIGFVAAFLTLATASECSSITHLPSLTYGAVLWGWWGLIASAAWKLAERLLPLSNFSFRSVSIHLLLASVLGFMHLVLLWSLCLHGPGWVHSQAARMWWNYLLNRNRFGIELLLYGFVLGIVGIIQYRIRVQRDALKAVELERQLSAAHLRALQMQLEPHFLFNTLNAITTLVELGRQQQAAEMLRHLNAILKSTLQRATPEKIPLSQELEMVENYLAIEQVRFADRLHLDIRVSPDALDGLVPCFLLQPIVENAIRHGIAHCEDEGLVEASAVRDGRFLQLHVRDSGSRSNPSPPNGHGIGLNNTLQRLTHFYSENFQMNAQPLAAGGFEVAITIPYERNE